MTSDPPNPDDPTAPGDGESSAQDPLADGGGAGNDNRNPPQPPSPDEDDDGVGYKRPPRKHRFQPGQSGNPAGRTKGAKGLKSILKKELNGRIRINENGKTRTISKMELMIKRLVEKGGKGDFKSIAKLLDLGALVFGMDEQEQNAPALTREEQAIIDEAAKRRRALAGKNGNRAPPTKRKSTTLQKTKTSKGEIK